MDLGTVTRFVSSQSFNSKDELIFKLSSFLGDNIIDIYKGTNTPSLVIAFQAGRKYIIKVEYSRSVPKKTIEQIKWYQFLKKLGRNLSYIPYFVDSYTGKHIAFYYLEYLDGYMPFDRYIINNTSDLERQAILKYFKALLDVIDNLSYLNRENFKGDVWQIFFINRAKSRLKEAEHFTYLKNLLVKEEIIINDQSFKNLPTQLKRLEDKVYSLYKREEECFQHGDLHLGNVLIKNNQFKIIDPNGTLLLPRFYDYGKLLQGIHGGYDLIHNKKFTLFEVAENKFIFAYPKVDVYQVLFSILKNRISERFLIKSLIAEVYHFISMLSHHAYDEQETTALYLQTLFLFDELWNILEG